MPVVLWIILNLIQSALASQMGSCASVKTQTNFEVEKYQGVWWEILAVPSFFIKTKACGMQNYTLAGSSLKVFTTGLDNYENKVMQKSVLSRKINSESLIDSGSLVVQAPGVPNAPYQVLATDYRTFSCVYSCLAQFGFKVEFAWVFGRTPHLEAEYVEKCNAVFRDNMIDPTILKKTKQGKSCPYYHHLTEIIKSNENFIDSLFDQKKGKSTDFVPTSVVPSPKTSDYITVSPTNNLIPSRIITTSTLIPVTTKSITSATTSIPTPTSASSTITRTGTPTSVVPTGAPTGVPTSVVPTGVPTSVVPTGTPTSIVPTGVPTSIVPTGVPTSVVPTGTPTSVVPTGVTTGTSTSAAPTSAVPTGTQTSAVPTGTQTSFVPAVVPTGTPPSASIPTSTIVPTSTPTNTIMPTSSSITSEIIPYTSIATSTLIITDHITITSTETSISIIPSTSITTEIDIETSTAIKTSTSYVTEIIKSITVITVEPTQIPVVPKPQPYTGAAPAVSVSLVVFSLILLTHFLPYF